MSELAEREVIKAEAAKHVARAQISKNFDVPVIVDRSRCIRGCRICIDSCPVDCLAVDPSTGKAHMRYDECWYCLACEIDCPKDAITVQIPFLVR